MKKTLLAMLEQMPADTSREEVIRELHERLPEEGATIDEMDHFLSNMDSFTLTSEEPEQTPAAGSSKSSKTPQN